MVGHGAGARRQLFKGANDYARGYWHSAGFVANEVECEQIVDAGVDWATGQPLWSAMVQVRAVACNLGNSHTIHVQNNTIAKLC